MIDNNIPLSESIQKSILITKNRFTEIITFIITSIIVLLSGIFLAGIGIIFTLSVSTTMIILYYNYINSN